MDKTLSNLLSNRNFLIGLVIVVVVVLFGWGYFTNGDENSDDNKDEQKQEQTTSTQDKEEEEEKSESIVSYSPAENAEVALANVPTQIVLIVSKELTAGSEIKVVSDKGLDVVTAGNKLTADLKTLSAPVMIEVAGKYTVSYQLNWNAGGSEAGSYTFTVK